MNILIPLGNTDTSLEREQGHVFSRSSNGFRTNGGAMLGDTRTHPTELFGMFAPFTDVA